MYDPEMEKTENEERQMCSVCKFEFEEQEEVTVLPCKHRYHKACIFGWFDHEKTCPICRVRVTIH